MSCRNVSPFVYMPEGLSGYGAVGEEFLMLLILSTVVLSTQGVVSLSLSPIIACTSSNQFSTPHVSARSIPPKATRASGRSQSPMMGSYSGLQQLAGCHEH